MTAETITPVPESTVSQESAAPVPRLVLILEGQPEEAVKLLRSVVAGAGKGGRRGPKLSAEVARVIRERLAAGEQKRALAQEYGVTVSTIEHIGSGRSYPDAAPA